MTLWIRLVLAFAVGVGIVLILEAGAYAPDVRFQHYDLTGINALWIRLLVAFVCSFALCFMWRPLRAGSPAPTAWLVDADSVGFLVPLVMVIGLTLTETVVLIRDTLADPAGAPLDYGFLAFQYIEEWVKLGVPALAGSMLARAMSWAVKRARV